MEGVLIQGGQQSVMLVTLPGYNVETATIDQTCFDSRWSGFTPYATGQLFSANDVAATFAFGETLDQPPLFLGHFVNLFNGSPLTVYENTPTMFRGGGTDQWWYALVTTSFLQFRAKFGNQAARLTFKLFRRTAG
jgi:hypothetical protein